jgi:hypothetical protein
LDRLEQAFVHDGSLLPRKNLALVPDLTDEEPVAEKVGEGASTERNAPTDLARAELSRRGADVSGSEVAHKLVDAADLQVPAEDQPYPFGFLFNDHKLAVPQFIAEGEGATYPEPLALGGGDLVANALGGDFPLELSKG